MSFELQKALGYVRALFRQHMGDEHTGRGGRAFRNADVALAATTSTAIALNGETYSTSGVHSVGTNPSRMYATASGFYEVIGNVSFGATSGYISARIHKNGSVLLVGALTGGAGGVTDVTVSDIIELTVGDYIELNAYSATACTVYGNSAGNATYLTMRKVI